MPILATVSKISLANVSMVARWRLILRDRKGTLMAEAWVFVDEVAKHLGIAKDSIYRSM